MGLVVGSKPGVSQPLELTQSKHGRVLIGLSWDARTLSETEKREIYVSGLKDVLKGDIRLFKANLARIHEKFDSEGRDQSDVNFDLDLLCFIYDDEGGVSEAVTPEIWNAINDTGHVYHSGENMLGTGGPDDEQIYIHLNNLPPSISEFFIVVQSDCAHTLKNILSPSVHVTDSQANKPLLKVEIDKLPDSDRYAFVFCRIYRKDSGWRIENISHFTDFDQDWPQYLNQFRT
jgi:stress response protein SCP2